MTVTRLIGPAIGLLVLTASMPALAEEAHSVDDVREGSLLSMTRFYTGSFAETGQFPGKLVCLRCDLSPSADATQCSKKGHRHALSMQEGGMVHPLVAGTKEVQDAINASSHHGKNVVVHGKYYSETGLIFVSKIDVQD